MENPLQKYLALVTTVEKGSFTKAAEELHYAQSTVSKMIADLEREWGMTLLERSKSGVRLTSAGEQLLPFLRKALNGYNELEGQIDRMRGLKTGIVRIGTFSSVATHWLPSIIREFQKDYPNIEYEFLLGDYREIEAWIQEGWVDCGFLCLPVRPDLDTIFLERDDFLAILPATHPLAQAERIFLDALCKEPFLMLEKDKNAEIADFFRREGLSPNVRFITWDDYAILSIVESGLGVSLLPRLILKRIPYQVAARETVPSFHQDIVLALRDRKTAPLAVRRFLEYLPHR